MSLTKVTYSMIAGAPINPVSYGAVGDGVTDSSDAVQAAVNTGANVIQFPAGTFLVKDVTLPYSVHICGAGEGLTIIKSISSTYNGYKYSSNIFTNTAGIDDLIISDLTLDGDGTSAPYDDSYPNEIPLVLVQDVTRTRFSNVIVTHYTAQTGPGVASETIFERHFQAITVRNLDSSEYVKFENVSFIDNYFEICDIYNGPNSECVVTVDKCVEFNTDSPSDSQTCFQFSGGHIILTNSYFYNTGAASTINLNVTKTSLIDGNVFKQQVGGVDAVGPSINYGQDGLYGQDNCTITNNYFEDVGAGCIRHSGGNNIKIANNTGVRGGLQPVFLQAWLVPATFAALYPAFTVPTLGPLYTVRITNNTFAGAQYTTGPSGQSIYLGYVSGSGSNCWNDVLIENNTLSQDAAPYDSKICVLYDSVNDIVIRGNYLNYKNAAILSLDLSRYTTIENNIFDCDFNNTSNEINFNGSQTNVKLIVQNNRFSQLPPQDAYNVYIASTCTFAEVSVLNNENMKPRYEISTTLPYLLKYEYGQRLSAAPSTGIWRKYDTIDGAPTSSQPMGWVCSDNGCFATFTATASGTASQYTLTVTDGTQFKAGQYITVNGVGSGGTFRYFVVCKVSGNTIYVDRSVLTSASGQTVTANNPTFKAMANFA